MQAIAVGRMLRMIRIRRGWRQVDVGARSLLSPAAIGRHENGLLTGLGALERHAGALGLRLDVRLTGRAGELVRLADEEHAAIVELLAAWFGGAGFVTEVEASFSEWGERGRIDLLAFDPAAGVLVIVEVKTQLLDLQELMGSLNVKGRLAVSVARSRGWAVRRQVSVLCVASTDANRRIVRTHRSLFAPLVARRLTLGVIRGRHLRILCWVSPPASGRKRAWIAGRQRVVRLAGRSDALA